MIQNNQKDLILIIQQKYDAMPNSMRKIANYILENGGQVYNESISELAKKCDVSDASVTKFVRLIGYQNYSQMKIALAKSENEMSEPDAILGELNLSGSIEEMCQIVFHKNIETLKNSLKILDYAAVDQAAEAIKSANKVDLYGMGSSSVATQNAKMRFYRLGIHCNCYSDPHEQIISASLLGKKDVAIGISNSGRSVHVVSALQAAKEAGAVTICITNFDDTPITACSDIILFTASKDSEILYESLHGRIAELSLIDALYVCTVSKMRNKANTALTKTSQAIQNTNLKIYNRRNKNEGN